MNQRIQELALKAWKLTNDETVSLGRTITQDEITDIFEVKFARLIVQDCVFISRTSADGFSAGRRMEEHFGVKE